MTHIRSYYRAVRSYASGVNSLGNENRVVYIVYIVLLSLLSLSTTLTLSLCTYDIYDITTKPDIDAGSPTNGIVCTGHRWASRFEPQGASVRSLIRSDTPLPVETQAVTATPSHGYAGGDGQVWTGRLCKEARNICACLSTVSEFLPPGHDGAPRTGA